MKQLLIIGLLLLSSCNPVQDRDPNYVTSKPKFEEDILVYVGDTEFIVHTRFIGLTNTWKYRLKKVDCRSDECYYTVAESEITKIKRSQIK